MNGIVFAKRVSKEILRDPLSYIFGLGFPVLLMIIMSIVDSSIPAQAEMTVFHVYNLAPGMAYFGLTFIMLLTSIQVSKDRTSALLLRLYASPMKSINYSLGYTIPMLILGVAQIVLCFVCAYIIGLFISYRFSVLNILFSIVLLIPSLIMFTGIGVLFGTAVNEKSAPGLCSIIISCVGMIGGLWMDVDGLGGLIKKIGSVLPFYHGVRLSRTPFASGSGSMAIDLIWTLGFAFVFYALAIWLFSVKMKKDRS